MKKVICISNRWRSVLSENSIGPDIGELCYVVDTITPTTIERFFILQKFNSILADRYYKLEGYKELYDISHFVDAPDDLEEVVEEKEHDLVTV